MSSDTKTTTDQKPPKKWLVIGIDTGVNTGFAVWDPQQRKLIEVSCYTIGEAFMRVWKYKDEGYDLYLRIEDARKRKWFPKGDIAQAAQGAGSVKRDASVWEDVCKTFGIQHDMIHPKDNKTKVNAETFKIWTGYKCKTNEHGRDAAMLCYGVDPIKLEMLKKAIGI